MKLVAHHEDTGRVFSSQGDKIAGDVYEYVALRSWA